MAIFPYHQEPASSWSKQIAEKKSGGTQVITVPVLWSHHESTQGMRDFSRGAKHRLERVLQYAMDHQVGVHIRTGFQNFLTSTPNWAQHSSQNSLDSVRSLVPKSVLLQQPSLTELSEIPSIHDRVFKQSWFSFLEELFIICSLYMEPENTVQKIEIDLRIFETDQGLLQTPGFASALKARYGAHTELNMLYGTTFRSFEQVVTSSAFKVLLEKRPWNAFYDYQWCRKWLLRKTEAEIRMLPSALTINHRLSFSTDNIEGHASAALLMDSVLFEIDGSSGHSIPFVCSPDGLIHAQSVHCMQIYNELITQGASKQVDFHLLKSNTSIDSRVLKRYSLIACLTTKYVDRLWIESLQKYLQEGGSVLFSAGLPQFDENLVPIHWKFDAKPQKDLEGFHSRGFGLGQVYLPIEPMDLSQDIWKTFSQWIEKIQDSQRQQIREVSC